ncbi:hypothetical protein LHJ74_24460 [Streptomyces sp. N2-109]|uniref:Uncharacterized protein n=1 Tax=Streptomyces gossypii TaxID=2883101 RepID=A0ABT2JYQ1_9ACTN|nr:hypothetical protein [Streptomyces gossypii]MCT2593027.1 hypothetical protein [Streptomyces gossypii]
MRVLSTASALTVAAAAPLLLVTGAHAAPGTDSGTVTLHNAATGEEADSGDFEVCTFFLDAADIDNGRRIRWSIVEREGDGTRGTVAETGTLSVDRSGAGRTRDLSLADGSYQLVWKDSGGNGGGRRTVFTVDCTDAAPSRSAPASPPATASPSREGDEGGGGPEVSGKPSTEATEPAESTEASERSPAGPADGPSASEEVAQDVPEDPAASPDGGSDLAESGAGVSPGALVTGGACLLGAGAYLLLRHRNARNGRHVRPGRG